MDPQGHLRVWQVKNGVSFNGTELLLCFFCIVLTVYYLSCFWFLISTVEHEQGDSSRHSWAEAFYYRTRGHYVSQEAHNPEDLFAWSLYHGIMTLTTIGYGDVVPSTNTERWISAGVMQLFGASS